jgi:SNF2 family DNA or RNA helicase
MSWLGEALRTGSGATPDKLPITCTVVPPTGAPGLGDLAGLRLRLESAQLRLLRGFDELLCLDGLTGIEHLPHQIETVRRVLRQFRGRVLLADEVGLGKTIEACLLLREYLLRGLAKRVLVLVPANLVPQWAEELDSKFHLPFAIAEPRSAGKAEFWAGTDRVLVSLSLAKSKRCAELVAAQPWDLVVVDEAHHCRNRATRSFQLVNSLRRRFCFLLSATPVQNDLVELYNLLTLLEPGHLRTEADFKRRFVKRGNPRDPRNREALRELLSQVMVRNTRSLVHIDLPPRYAQTLVVEPGAEEAACYRQLDTYLRWRLPRTAASDTADTDEVDSTTGPLTRMQVNTLLLAAGSHPAALAGSFRRIAGEDPQAAPLLARLAGIGASAKERRLVELLRSRPDGKALVFATFRDTVDRLDAVLTEAGISHTVFHGGIDAAAKRQAVLDFRDRSQVLLATEAGGEGHNLQFCDTLVNFDLPWNPMRIEQRIGRIHRYGQKNTCFVFNLCCKGSLEERLLHLLGDKIRMFELVVGEVGSILGNLEGGDEFETLVLNLWLGAGDAAALDAAFEQLGERILAAKGEYGESKELDEALFGDDFE